MLVKTKQASKDNYENIVFVCEESNLLKVENNALSEEKQNMFRYRNIDVFCSDTKNNLLSAELFDVVDSLYNILGLSNNVLVGVLTKLYKNAEIELAQVFVQKENNSFIQSEICSIKVSKEGLAAFKLALKLIVNKETFDVLDETLSNIK